VYCAVKISPDESASIVARTVVSPPKLPDSSCP
jgi:hypothetical protein